MILAPEWRNILSGLKSQHLLPCYFFLRQPCLARPGDRSSGVLVSPEQGQLAEQFRRLAPGSRGSSGPRRREWSSPSEERVIKPRAALAQLQEAWRLVPGNQGSPVGALWKGVNESLHFSGWLRWLLLIFFEFRSVISVHTWGLTGRWVNIFLIVPGLWQGCDKIWVKMWLCKNV